MSVRGSGANILERDTGRSAHRLPDLVRPFIGEDLDVEVEDDCGSGIVFQREGSDPKVHINAFGLFMLLRAPATVRDIGRRVRAAAPGAGEECGSF